MKLSVITINYNNAEGLRHTMHSVLMQTFKDFEYIVIDGGSTDGSKKVIEKNRAGVAYWVSERDNGIYHAMNKGVRVAKGDYCLFLNSGDYLLSETSLEDAFNQDITAEIATADLIYTTGTVFPAPTPKAITMDFFLRGTLSHPSSFIARSLLIEHPYNENFRIVADHEFFMYALIKLNASYQKLKGVLSVFDVTGISSTSRRSETEVALFDKAVETILQPRVKLDYDKFTGKNNEYYKLFYLLSFSEKYKWIYRINVLLLKILLLNKGFIKKFSLRGKFS